MPCPYQAKSHEELRFDDYKVGNRGKGAAGGFGGSHSFRATPTAAFGGFGATTGFIFILRVRFKVVSDH